MIRVQDGRLQVETRTLTAVIEKGFLTSLKSKQGEEFLRPFDRDEEAALQLVYRGEEVVPVDDLVPQTSIARRRPDGGECRYGSITCLQLSDHRAEIVVHGWDGDGVIWISEDPESGDLIVQPSAYSSRAGVRSCRWVIRGIREDLDLVAPFNQGVRLKLNDPLIAGRCRDWPQYWEAQLAILQGQESGFWVHCQDTRYRYKALKIGTKSEPFAIGLDSEAYGPIDDSLGAGGVAWRINVHRGDWKVPAARYRDWLWQAYDLKKAEARRPVWLQQITLAFSWFPTDPDMLEAVAKWVNPSKVLIHLPGWRTDGYDQNYPHYVASEGGAAVIRQARAMGYHVGPHFNAVDIDPTHPVYALLRDFQYRDLETTRIPGWAAFQGQVMFPPQSNATRMQHRDKNVMARIHPGFSMWRSVLGQSILRAAQEHGLDIVFTDVTWCVRNLHNCLAEGTTPAEGMLLMINHVAELGDGLAVGGEGLNETSMQGLSFAQAHLLTFIAGSDSPDDLKRSGGCDLNQFLWGKLCRIIGYHGLSGRTETEELNRCVYDSQGAIATLTVRSAEEITNPNPAVERVLEKAGAG